MMEVVLFVESEDCSDAEPLRVMWALKAVKIVDKLDVNVVGEADADSDDVKLPLQLPLPLLQQLHVSLALSKLLLPTKMYLCGKDPVVHLLMVHPILYLVRFQ